MQGSAGEGSGTRNCPGPGRHRVKADTLLLSDAGYAAQAVTVDGAKCQEAVQDRDECLLVQILWLGRVMLRQLELVVLFFEEIWWPR